MSKLHASVLSALLLALLSGCEKTAAPPPEAATAPTDTAAPAAAATPVATSEPSAAEAVKEPPPAATPPEPSTSAVASAPPAPSAAPPKETAPKAAAGPKAAPASAEAAPAPAGPTPDDACQTKNFHYSQVAGACKSGGRKAAKNVMKGAVAKAKAAGTDLKCTSCHQDMKDFHLKPNAVGDLKNWL